MIYSSSNHTKPFTLALGIAFTILTLSILGFALMNGGLDFRSRAAGKSRIVNPIINSKSKPTIAPTRVPTSRPPTPIPTYKPTYSPTKVPTRAPTPKYQPL